MRTKEPSNDEEQDKENIEEENEKSSSSTIVDSTTLCCVKIPRDIWSEQRVARRDDNLTRGDLSMSFLLKLK